MKGSHKEKKKKKQTKKSNYPSGFLIAVVLSLFISVSITIALTFIRIKNIQAVSPKKLHTQPIENITYPILNNEHEPVLTAQSAIVYNTDTKTTIYEKNANYRFTPASTVKIMTALVALDVYKLDDVLKATGVSTVEGSKMGLFEGEEMKVSSLLYGLMLPSGNDVAHVFASNHPGGGYPAFINHMNIKAKQIGLINSQFVDPSGYNDANFTTAKDLTKLAIVALKNPYFREVVATKRITLSDSTGEIPHTISNLNRLLDYSDVYGIKTGFTNEAGEVLVTSIHYKDQEYIVVVLKSEDRFQDTEKIMAEIIRSIETVKL